MCDAVKGDVRSSHRNITEEFENTNMEDVKPVCEEITTMKTEIVEEFYDHGSLVSVESDDVKPFSTSEYNQSVMDECQAISPYEQILKNDCYEQHIVWLKEGNDFRLSKEDAAAKIGKKYACDKCTYITNHRSNFLRHTLVHGKRQFMSKTCRSSFRRTDHLKKHVKTHDDEGHKKVCCPHCKKTYGTNGSLQRHIDVQHAYKKYKCELCDYTTAYKYFLTRHEQIKHGNGSKLYKCKYCEYSAHYKTSLQNHERTHSNVTLLKCTYKNCMCELQHVPNKEKSCHCDPCQFETAYRDSLRKHILVKHSTKAERHTCTVCTYSTHVEEYLRKHMRIHDNKKSPIKYECEYCDHTTHSKKKLKKHTLTHTNEKMFKCTYINCKCAQRHGCIGAKPCDCETCGYQTVLRSALIRHILTKHGGEAKKHTCIYCDYSTHVKGYLERHLLGKHANAKSIPSETS